MRKKRILHLTVVVSFFVLTNCDQGKTKKEIVLDQFTDVRKAIESKDILLADSLLRQIDEYKISNGITIKDSIKLQLKRAEFRIELDDIEELIIKGEIQRSERKYYELVRASINMDYLTRREDSCFNAVAMKLQKAKDTSMEPYKEQAEIALKQMRTDFSEFEKITWYQDLSSPKYNDQNGFYLYFGEQKSDYSNGIHPLRLKIQYSSNSWLFHKSVKVMIDGEVNTLIPKKVKRDHGSGRIWEWSDQPLGAYFVDEESMFKWIADVINSKETQLKFVGRKYYDVVTLNASQKEALKRVLLAYIAKGEFVPFMDKVISGSNKK